MPIVTGHKRGIPTGLLYISPWIIGFTALLLYPLLAALVYSFTNYSILRPSKFVGLANYIRMFTIDDEFANSVKLTFLYAFTTVPVKLSFALIIALILNTKIKGIGIIRTVYYLPSIFGGSVALALLWRHLFAIDGFVNLLLGKIGIDPIAWLGNPRTALFTISLLPVWQFGSSMVLFLAALKQVPKELFEAAEIDGATKIRKFISITFPFLTPIILFNLVMQMINAFQNFTAPYIVTQGGPNKATNLFVLLIYKNGFEYFKMGYASALSWLLFIFLVGFSMLVFKSSKAWVYYDN